MAVNCSVSPLAMLGLAGVTAIDTNVAEVTVSVVLPEMLPLVAEIVVLPAAAELASPCEPPALLIVATRGVGGGPGHLRGEILRRAVGVGAGGGELLGQSIGDAGVGGGHRDRHQRRRGDRQRGAARDGCRSWRRSWCCPLPPSSPVPASHWHC